MIVSLIVLPALLVSILIVSRMMGFSFRTAFIFMALNATIGLMIFSTLTTIPQISAHTLSALPPGKMVAIACLIFMFELLSGTYVASKVLSLNYYRFLKLTVAALALTLAISIPLCLLAYLFKP